MLGHVFSCLKKFVALNINHIVCKGVCSSTKKLKIYALQVKSGLWFCQESHRAPLLVRFCFLCTSTDIQSEIRLIEDDCVCYREIMDEGDTLKHHKDIVCFGF